MPRPRRSIMGISDLRVGLIGHSHAVCLLDALGDWRDRAGLSTAAQDQRYGEAFRGWFDVDTGGDAFTLAPQRTTFPAPAELVTCVLTAKVGEMTTTRNVGKVNEVRITPVLEKCVQQFRNIGLVVSVLHGNEAASIGLVDNHPPYDFAPLDDDDALPLAPPPFQPIDRIYIARWVDSFARRAILAVTALQRSLPSTRVVHVLPPPPLEDPARLVRRELLENLLAEHGFVRPLLRLKWSLAYRARVRTALEAQGIQVIGAPRAALTASGFLREDLGEGLTHGNGHYGAMLWEALDGLLGAAK